MNHFIYTSRHFTPHGKTWTQSIDLAPNVWLHSSGGRASHRYRGGHGFESRWSPDIFFSGFSFQLLKLENLLRWSFITFIYHRSTNMNHFIYTSRHFTPHGKTWTQLIDLAPNVWLHSSVGRASRRYRGGHGFESRWSPDIFFSGFSFQLLKLENLLRWSFITFIYHRSTNMNHFIYTSRHFTPHGKTWTQLIDLAPNVWLHSSVGRASRRYRGGHGFESRWNPDFFSGFFFPTA